MSTPFQPMLLGQVHDLATISGKTLTSVTYFYLPPDDKDEYLGGLEGVDFMLTAIRLDFGLDGYLMITWSTPGYVEGLSVVNDKPYPGGSYLVLDASKRAAWSRHIGTKVAAIGASWQTMWTNGIKTLWALRLDFGGESVVVALGKANPVLSYIPDEIVVVYDENIARSYRISEAKFSAWGEAIL